LKYYDVTKKKSGITVKLKVPVVGEQIQPATVKVLQNTAAIRVFHWILVASLTTALLTGLQVSFAEPLFLTMRTLRLIHMSGGFVAFAAVLYRIGYAFITGDYRNFSINFQDLKTFPHLIRYYLFLEKRPPKLRTKYNVGQKFVFFSWIICTFYLTFAGILLYNSYFSQSAYNFHFLQKMLPPVYNRLLKYYVTIYMLSTIMLHIYLAHTEDIAKSHSIFTGWIKVKKPR